MGEAIDDVHTPWTAALAAPAAPYPYLRTGHLGCPPLPEGVGTAVDLSSCSLEEEVRRGLDLVVLGADAGHGHAGRGEGLSPVVRDLLITCEGEGIPTVLRIEEPEHLEGPLAAVVSHSVTTRSDLHSAMLRRWGVDRALLMEPVVDPRETLLERLGDPEAAAAERITARRELIGTRSPAAQASRLLGHLGVPVEADPLVTALIVSRRAENLDRTLENLKRQDHPRMEALLVIDPLHEERAQEALTRWDVPVRLIRATPRSTVADRLNIGIDQAAGRHVAVIEETALYGAGHITDLLQAVRHSGADLVGRASWFVKADDGEVRIRAPKLQRTFDEPPALGTLMMRTETARRIGFSRRAAKPGPAIAERTLNAGGTIFAIHAHDVLMLRRGQSLDELSEADLHAASSPSSAPPSTSEGLTSRPA
ncbi:glycosyltransferase [Nesterenkonia sp. PF2B19]|uniref:glycosyltransferase n=1 Tax=Nesterenkonia sp. PF2B19 TaxID=1881858 RepID=UPI0008725202|nr:glycosyltransferase [Nesterenkonia sp. PF2B19]OSM42634.1 hypothetical protein BCY76_013190 [Nesterenkonia sp. PF2B19]